MDILKKSFKHFAITKESPKWELCITRIRKEKIVEEPLKNYFTKDYNRILFCKAFRRLRNKTQVFFKPVNDHICTRLEHVNLVSSIAYTICNYLGLNKELTNAIAMAHDLGHSPFGHPGEKILTKISEEFIGERFWHEKNSLNLVDHIELLKNIKGKYKNLNLTYAVRDGIICHCGEVDQNKLFPRNDFINLMNIKEAGKYNPFTWEGCIVKLADKISYLGRDIEDAITLNILTDKHKKELKKLIKEYSKGTIKLLNNSIILHELITDLCNNSSPEQGLSFSEKAFTLIKNINSFNYKNIYGSTKLIDFREYAALMINTLFKKLIAFYNGKDTINKLLKQRNNYPTLIDSFREFLIPLSKQGYFLRGFNKYINTIIYDLTNEKQYMQACIDFISTMTDNFVVRLFKEIIYFE